MHEIIIQELEKLKDPEKAKILSRFFKTGKWEYWYWDKFLWIQVPQQREIAKKYFKDCSFNNIEKLLKSEFHEIRLTALLILCYQYELATKKSLKAEQKEIVRFYLEHLEFCNNWDLVDLVCYKILWNYLIDKDRKVLYELATDSNMRKQRVAIVSTMTFMKNGDFTDTLKIAKMLIHHNHDLIHKAVWRLLREVWKKDETVLKSFLDENIKDIHRTTLRYSIERLCDKDRAYYLNI